MVLQKVIHPNQNYNWKWQMLIRLHQLIKQMSCLWNKVHECAFEFYLIFLESSTKLKLSPEELQRWLDKHCPISPKTVPFVAVDSSVDEEEKEDEPYDFYIPYPSQEDKYDADVESKDK
jgi:hypothetical protein